MEIKSLEDLVNLQRELVAHVQREFRRPPRAVPPDADLRADFAAKEAALTDARESLRRAREAQAESARRYDAEVKAREEVVARLEQQLKVDKEELERVLQHPRADEPSVSEPPSTGGPPTAPRPNVDSAAHPARRVDEVPGIGGGLASRLAAHGITQLADLAAVEPARLAQILEVSKQRAVSMIDSARRLLTRGPTE